MTDFVIGIAGCAVGVRAFFETTRMFCSEYLCERTPDFSVEMTEKDIVAERDNMAKLDQQDGVPIRDFSDAYLETIALHRKVAEELFAHDTIMFHGSVVAVDGAGYLFAAKSGTGKSTHTRLWRQMLGDRAVMINDDKPMLRMVNGQVLAYGTPWNGKHRLSTNTCVPLRAICLLERGEENSIYPISVKEALVTLLQQSNRPADPAKMPKYLELLDLLAQGVRFYRLRCNMEPEAAQIAYQIMSEE